ncbi:MAG: SAM-dependent chlorinase/fluorinase [Acidimicrobiales bacterium]|nr:SAM-dependent chlorinase/fluorinase [Acidimicrobiales bacterium]
MGERYQTVSFLSDYGTDDEFVGVVHSVLASVAPHVRIVDVTHRIAAHDVRAGGLALARSAQYLCAGVVLAVVDPGAGTARRRIAVEVGGGQSVLVGPDNGLLAPAVAMVGGADRAISLTDPTWHIPSQGTTDDGRDVFAPVAAHLACGIDLAELGEEIDPNSLLPAVVSASALEPDGLHAEVWWIDRFGNVQLNAGPEDLDELARDSLSERFRVRIADRVLPARRVTAFDEVEPGGLGLLVDSAGLVSLVMCRMSAADDLGLRPSDSVVVEASEGIPAVGAVTPVSLGVRPSVDVAPEEES